MLEKFNVRYDRSGKPISTERVPADEDKVEVVKYYDQKPTEPKYVRVQQPGGHVAVELRQPKPQKESCGYTLAAQMVGIGITDRAAIAQAVTELYRRETTRGEAKIARDVASVFLSLEKGGLI